MIGVNGNMKLIPSTYFEQNIIRHCIHYFSGIQKLGVNLPVVAMLTLLGVQDYGMADSGPNIAGYAKIDRDILIIPGIIIQKFEISPRDLKPMLDSVWNAGGYYESRNFDSEGNYTAR
jgi:hypothetical protein